jgi:integrase/recombinase XerD
VTDQFIKERMYLKGVSPKTVAWYRDSFKSFEGALDSKSTIIDRIAVLRNRNVRAVSVNTWLRAINAYYMWLHKEHGKELVRIPKLKEEQKVLATLAPADISKLLHLPRDFSKSRNLRRAHFVALTILDTGLRASEALGLSKEDVNWDSLVLRVKGKGNKHRQVPFSFELRKFLIRYVSVASSRVRQGYPSPALLFGTKNHTQLSVRNLERDFAVLGQKLGITGVRFSPHTLRHSFAVGYLRKGGNLFYLSKILGHSSVKTTERYLQSLGIEDLQAVHNRLSLLARG